MDALGKIQWGRFLAMTCVLRGRLGRRISGILKPQILIAKAHTDWHRQGAMIRKWFESLSQNQKWILFCGGFLIVIFTLIHNPLSGFYEYDDNVCTVKPLGDYPYGYLKLGMQATYLTFVMATVILTAIATALTSNKKG